MAPRPKGNRIVARKSTANKDKLGRPAPDKVEDSAAKREEEEQKKREQEEQEKREQEEKIRREQEEKRRREEEEQRRREQEEQRRREQEEKIRREEEEQRRREEEEQRRREEGEAERKKEEDEQREREEEQRRKEEEAKKKKEEEAKKKREEEEKKKREEEAKKKKEEEAKRKRETEAKERQKKEDREETPRTSARQQVKSRPQDLQHHPTTSEPLSNNSDRQNLANISYLVLSSLIPELKWISLDFFTRAVSRYADQLPETISAAIQIFYPGAFAVRYFFDPNRTDHVAACFKTPANTTSSFIRQQNCWYSITRTGLSVKAPDPSDLPDLICVVYPA